VPFHKLEQVHKPSKCEAKQIPYVKDIAHYETFGGIVLNAEEGLSIAAALGNKKAAILSNHGILTCGQSIESCIFW
jgi:ribulose-5-phosphate 4-epimerase/fuculose-1-phosphate aldolase